MRTNYKIKPWVWWLAACASLIISLIQTPVAIQDFKNLTALNSHAQIVQGKVVAHENHSGKYARNSTATIRYEVKGRQYQTQVKGRGANEDRLPNDTLVNVKYLPDMPAVALVKLESAETPYLSWWELSGLWLLSLILCGIAIFHKRLSRLVKT